MEFKKALIEKMTGKLQIDKSEIVDVHFGFNNSRMLD